MKRIKEIVIAGLILFAIAGIGYFVYEAIKKRKKEKDFQYEIMAAKYKIEIDKIEENSERTKEQLEHESKLSVLLHQLGYTEKQIRDTIRKKQDEIYFDTLGDKYTNRDIIDWYKEFRQLDTVRFKNR